MAKLEKDSSKYLDKGISSILEKIDEICEQYRKANVNKQIAEVDKWDISDFFGVNDLERIKQTPEYIIEKILIKFKDFINLNGYFFIMKPRDNLKNFIENKVSRQKKKNEKEEKEKELDEENKEEPEEENEKKSEKKREKKSGEKKNNGKEKTEKNINVKNKKEKNKKIEKKNEGKKEEDKKKEKKNNEKKGEKDKESVEEKKYKEEMKNESEEEEKKKKSIKKYKIKSNKEKHSNSMNKKIPNLLFYKYNLNIHSEEENEFSNNFNIKRSNSLFHKYDINNVLDKKNFLNNSNSKKHNRLLNREKELNNNKKDSLSSSKNEFERNPSNFSSIKDNLSNIKSIEYSSNIKNSSSKSKNRLENNTCTFSSKNKSSSTFDNLPYSDSISSINEEENKNKKKEKDEKKKEDMDSYKLRFFKNKLNLEEGEILSGDSYEEYARKTIKLMFILSIKIVPIFDNPQKIATEPIIAFYKKQLELSVINKIDTPIGSSIFEQTKKDKHFEIDIVFELKKNEIIKFIEKYNNKIYFQNHFLNKKDKDTKEKVTCYMEISRNLIFQGKEKLGQIKKYIKIIKIMNNMRKSVSHIDQYKNLLIPYKSSDSTEKIFSIITDGNYEELNFVINEIVIPNLNNSLDTKIKNAIKNKINEKPKLFDNIENKDSLIDNIYYVFEIFYHLQINEIKFCLIYIGEICESTYGLRNILDKLKNLDCLNKNGMDLNDYTIKKSNNLEELKKKYHEIKSIIHEFEKKCENNIVFNKKSIDKIFDKIDFNIFDFDCFISQIKLECKTYIFSQKEDKKLSPMMESEDIIISNFKKYFKFYTKHSQLSEIILNQIFKFIEQDKHTIYFLIFDGYLPDYLITVYSQYRMKNIFIFSINNEKYNKRIYFNAGDFIKEINIESRIKDKLQEEIKRNQLLFSEEIMLMPINLENKLTKDLNVIFKINGILNLQDIVKEIEFDIPEENEKELIEYFNEILDKLEIKKIKIDCLEIEKVFKTNLEKLKKNILSRHFYNLFIYKIGQHFIKKFKEELMKSIELCNKR